MTIHDIISEIIQREGGYVNDASDRGGRTIYGIAERFHPDAWKNGPPTQEEARAIYEAKYVKAPGFDKITDPRLQEQMVDFGVNSGPQMAIKKLQVELGVAPDGVLGPKTLTAIEANDPRLLNNRLALARIKMIGRIVHKDRTQAKFLNGWLERAGSFFHF